MGRGADPPVRVRGRGSWLPRNTRVQVCACMCARNACACVRLCVLCVCVYAHKGPLCNEMRLSHTSGSGLIC